VSGATLRTASGFTIIADGDTVLWNDPETGEWEMSPTNKAGKNNLAPYDLSKASLRENADGKILIGTEPNVDIEMIYVGAPFFWGFNFIRGQAK